MRPGWESRRERLVSALCFQETDRVPLLGGWVLGDRQHQTILGITADVYWQDPQRYTVGAHRALGVDGMIALMVPHGPDEYRDPAFYSREHLEYIGARCRGPEDVLAYAKSLPSSEETLRAFDADAWDAGFRAEILDTQTSMGDMVYLPTLWEVVHPKFEWYWDFGYENYLLFMQLYPEAADAFFAGQAGVARRKAELVVEAYREFDMVPMTLIGTDICGGGGPVISPRRLREVYFPHVRYAIEPLREAGIRPIWHSDGDFRPIVDDLLACGIAGFQGFQEEYGVDIADLVTRRTLDGEKLTVIAGPSVTTTLPYGTVEDVRSEMERIIATLAGECALFILPANNILPDCPAENVVAMYETAASWRGCAAGGTSRAPLSRNPPLGG